MNYDYLTSAVKVSIPQFQESKTQSGTFFFTILLEAKDNKWYIEKRFSEFDQLYNGLKNIYHNLPTLPKKSYLFKITEKDFEARRAGLEDFLRKIIVRNDLTNSELVKQFLQLDKNASDMMINPPKLLSEYTIEGQTKGIRDYIYVEEKGLFFVATADMSPVSRFNAKVTNTKLPWQTEGGKFMEVGSIQCWQFDLQSSKFSKIWSKGYPHEATSIFYDQTSENVLIGLDDGVVDIVHLLGGHYNDVVCDRIHKDRVTGLAYETSKNIVYSISQDKNLRVGHGSSLALIIGIPHRQQLLALIKDTLNKRLFCSTKVGEIFIYDISSAQKPKNLAIMRNNKGGSIRALSIDLNRNYLFTGSFEAGEINVFDLDKPGREKLAKITATLMGKEKVRAIAWSAKRAEIFTGTADGSITIWNAIQGKIIYVLQSFDNQITRIEYLPQKEALITTSKGKSIKIWTLPKEWRDAKLVADERKQVGKFINDYNKEKLANTIKKAEEDSDEDDLAGWHLD